MMLVCRFTHGLAVCGFMLSSSVLAGAPVKRAEVPYLTLDGDQTPTGPIPEPGVAYASEVAMLLLRVADSEAAFFVGEENPGAYFAFLAGALAVPLHESGLRHFRKLDRLGDRCSQAVQDTYTPVFKDLGRYLMGRCDRMSADRPALQLIGSTDGLSMGLMQINVYAHPDYVRRWEFLSVPDTIKRGLSFLRDGFEELFDQPERYPCLHGENGIELRRVVRGVWSGIYQSGNHSRSCRWAQTGKDADARDAKFAGALESALSLEEGFYAKRLSGTGLQLYRQAVEGFLAAEAGAPVRELQSRAEALRDALKELGWSSKQWLSLDSPVRRGRVVLAPGRKAIVRDWWREDARAVPGVSLRDGARVWIYDRFKSYTDNLEWYSIAPRMGHWISEKDVKLIGP